MSNVQQGVFFYSKSNCKYCDALEADLKASGTVYSKHTITSQEESNRVKTETNRQTFPILFINKVLVGGYSEYHTLALTNQIACDF